MLKFGQNFDEFVSFYTFLKAIYKSIKTWYNAHVKKFSRRNLLFMAIEETEESIDLAITEMNALKNNLCSQDLTMPLNF